ncbi:MAG: EscU/YscU/HrcU family type III secretion system export apparatus switch protein [Actinomycetota bacterium]|nr:EscU/YscU/HrcU family type III secretion system export apparatus switch protein [Actinomycetota bacterium]
MPPAADKHAKTEKPTPKRKKEARQNGQVPRSPDVSSWAAALVGSFILPLFFASAKGRILGVTSQALDVMGNPSVNGAVRTLSAGLRAVLYTAAPLAGGFTLLAIVANIAQTGRTFSFKAAQPKFNRLSPGAGFKRLFSPQSGLQLARQVLKLGALSGIGYEAMRGLMHEVINKQPVSLLPLLSATAASIFSFIRIVSLLGLLIGLADYGVQRHRINQSMKMTKEEVKQEHRNQEGDPHMKAHLRKRMYQIARSKAIRNVRQADVVVTNPTHYAVALAYDAGRSMAPRVVAKGSDRLAARIREEAATFAVPIVEDPPLARYLYAVCDLDAPIPNEIYVAVARILAFVYSLPPTVRSAMVHRPAHSTVPAEPEAMASLSEEQRRKMAAVLAGDAA